MLRDLFLVVDMYRWEIIFFNHTYRWIEFNGGSSVKGGIAHEPLIRRNSGEEKRGKQSRTRQMEAIKGAAFAME